MDKEDRLAKDVKYRKCQKGLINNANNNWSLKNKSKKIIIRKTSFRKNINWK